MEEFKNSVVQIALLWLIYLIASIAYGAVFIGWVEIWNFIENILT